MVVGILIIIVSINFLAVGVRWSENMAKRFRRQLGSEIDPAIFKVAIWIVGLAGIIFGIVKITAALR